MKFYIPTVPEKYDSVYFSKLLRDMQNAVAEIREQFIYIEEVNAVIAKPRNGIIVYADGTNWDPGQGRGLYQYQNGAWVLIQGNKKRNHVFSILNLRKGATAPVDSTLGTTPTVPTLYFSATNELVSGYITMHEAWDKNYDLELELVWALATAQTN